MCTQRTPLLTRLPQDRKVAASPLTPESKKATKTLEKRNKPPKAHTHTEHTALAGPKPHQCETWLRNHSAGRARRCKKHSHGIPTKLPAPAVLRFYFLTAYCGCLLALVSSLTALTAPSEPEMCHLPKGCNRWVASAVAPAPCTSIQPW